ncbi:hypothetical protein [Niallia sp. Krafla_26]|uniref:hypothetical protein n=1 Tax=Niallia sp. Krafla_26 TaxID=3064703 RepID=UPI003D1840D3
MPRFLKYLFTFMILSVFLVACGTSTDTDETANEAQQLQQEQTKETQEEKEDDTKPNTEGENIAPDQKNNDDQKVSPPTEMKLKYSRNGESIEETAMWKKSDNQPFGLYVLPSYVLTAEEPRMDQVYFSEDGSHYMRISILTGDINFEEQKENTLAQLQAVNEDVQTLNPPEDEFYKNATVMQTKLNNELVTAYLIPQDKHLIKLMISTKEQDNHLDAFIQMAKHIQVD